MQCIPYSYSTLVSKYTREETSQGLVFRFRHSYLGRSFAVYDLRRYSHRLPRTNGLTRGTLLLKAIV